jgi:hypothetical protein
MPRITPSLHAPNDMHVLPVCVTAYSLAIDCTARILEILKSKKF